MIQYLPNVLILFGIFGILGISFGLVMGQAGLFSMATGMVFGIGAYTGALLTRDAGLGTIFAVAAGAAVAAIVSVILAYAALRVADMYFVVATLAVQIGFTELMHNLEITGGSSGVVGIPRPNFLGVDITSAWAWTAIVLVTLLGAAYLYRYIVSTQLGQTLRTMRDDTAATLSLGRNVTVAKIKVFAISSAMAAAAGVMFAAHIRFISPAEFTLNRSVDVLEFSILGGIGSVTGPILGAAIAVAVPEILATLDLSPDVIGGVRTIIFAVAVLLVVRFRPLGIITGARRSRRRSRPANPIAGSENLDFAQRAAGPLTCDGVTVNFGGQTALNNVSLVLEPGIVIGLVGPNGAGKTTLFNVLTGAISPNTGSVSWNGRDVTRLSPDARARLGIARSFQDLGLFRKLTALENVAAAVRAEGGGLPRGRSGRAHADAQAMELLERVGLGDSWNVKAGELGYAQQKMLMMARLMSMRASAYLLDEPMSGMDRAAREAMVAIVRELARSGAVVCLVEHSLEVIRGACDEAVFLGAGVVLKRGPAAEITRDEELVTAYFGR